MWNDFKPSRQLKIYILFVFAAIAVIWVFYIAYGHQMVRWLYDNRDNLLLNKILGFIGDSNQPLARYLAKAQRLIFELSWISLLMVMVTYVITRKFKDPRVSLGILIFIAFMVRLIELIMPSLLTVAAYHLIWLWLLVLSLVFFTRMKSRKNIVIEFIVGFIIIVFLLTVFEFFTSSLNIIPPFPKYLMRYTRWNVASFNSMGFLDKERFFENTRNIPRVLFIGDSMLEIGSFSIVPGCEQAVESKVNKNVEFINLGESDTDPVDYYWRIKNIGMRFNPDIVLIFIAEVNDFISRQRVVRGINPNNLIAIYPQQSIFSRFFPRTTSLFSALYYYARSFKGLPWVPRGRNWADLSQEQKEEKLIELISEKGKVSSAEAGSYVRGLSADTRRFVFDSGYLPGYYFEPLVNSVFHNIKQENRCKAEYTARCIIEMKNLLLKKIPSAKIMVFFIPAAEKADPVFLNAFQDLFKTGGLPFGQLLDDKEYIIFNNMLRDEGIGVYNLSGTFNGLRGTYALDGHWNKKGAELAVEYISLQIEKILAGFK